MNAQSLTPVQKDLLKMFSYDHSDKFAFEIKEVLTNHFLSKIDAETDKLWADGVLNQAALDNIRKEDLHFHHIRHHGSIGR